MDRWHIGNNDRHCTGRLDGHERRTRGETAGEASHHGGVQPEHRIHSGQQTAGQTIGNTLYAEDQAGDGVFPNGLAREQ